MQAVKTDDVQATITEAKGLLSDVLKTENDYRLKNCLNSLEKLEALMRADYEAVWRLESEQRKREAAFHERFIKSLRTLHNERLQEVKQQQQEDTPLAAALRALAAAKPPPFPPTYPPLPTDEELYE